MYITITGSANNKDVYITRSYRKENGKTSSSIYRKLGKYNELLSRFDGDEGKMMAWAKEEAKKETEKLAKENASISITLSQTSYIPKNEERNFNVGYLFLQKICTQLRLSNICRSIKLRHKYDFNLEAILTDLVYARILEPSSKLSSYEFCKSILEPPKYSMSDVYRALSVMSDENDFIQEELYRNSNFIHPRNDRILYYDCTNYFFEIEEDDNLRRYGKSKEHRPNPIVTMGLFMDADGMPLAFDIFPGNQNEQTTLKPLETKVIKDFGCSKFIYCSDAGLGGKPNRLFNSIGDRAYVVTQSLKKLNKDDKEDALSPKNFRKIGDDGYIDISTLDETNEVVFNTVYYKEIPVNNKGLEETLIVTYSPKYKAYERSVRERQIERAKSLIETPSKRRKGKNENDPARFIKQTSVTSDGEVAEQKLFSLDEDRITEEEKYDGYYAVITNLEDDIEGIIKINKQRWKIEENFRIMKTDFEARPIYVRREDRIRAHFLICFISLLIYRLLENELDEKYTCENILRTLRNMQMTRLSKDSGYTPSYKRTDLTDALHKAFGFHTDYEFISKSRMRAIIKETKTISKGKTKK